TIDRHISVTAGPGSGKTTVLVERYLHILRKNPNLNIDQIVAITFTNRAANEMRERLRGELNRILQTAAADQRRHWLNYKRTLDGAVITTIHGFCARLLREFPVEARIDPQFLLLDEHRAAMLLEAVVEEALNEFIGAGHVEISRLTLGVGRGKLAEALGQLYREVRGQGLSLVDLALRTAQSHATEADHAVALVELSRTMNNFLGVRRTTPAARAKHAEAMDSWSRLQPLIGTVPEVDALADYCRAVEGFRKARPSAIGDLKEHIQALDALVWEKELVGRVPQIALDLFAKQYALEIALLLNRIDERLNEEKQKISALDFDDLELRALELLKRPEVMTRAAERYKFFLVDEFQDTNGLQRRLLEQLALRKSRRESANLFIVGDRKQSIYGFRGADVAVFSEMTDTVLAAGGESKPLLLNFRSQPPLINFFNFLFARLFQPGEDVSREERAELGYVDHEPSEAKRELRDSGTLVELMVTTEASGNEDDPKAEQTSRELDAEQLAIRIISLVDPTSAGSPLTGTAGVSPASNTFTQVTVESDRLAFNGSGRDARGPSKSGPGEGDHSLKYSDIALLFRAMTHVQTYETAFRRANIPYQTVLGRGFYEREEITDLIQLLRFLDNKTDELALAAVLRSPLCGISDNALLALRCAPWLDEIDIPAADSLRHFSQTRKLYLALRRHRDIAFISDDEHLLLDRAADMIKGLIARQHHYALSTLLRFAVEQSEYETVIAATFDGAQRLANVQRLYTLAERFDRSGHHLIRDFVRYVEEFEAIGSRESEGQIDEATNAVKLMTIHQAKGLEFPVVIIPDLQRSSKPPDNWVLLDRQGGLTLKVPDGRGKLVAGLTFNRFQQRHANREQFESMRLLYVAATRAQDRLILSGTTKDLEKVGVRSDTWLNWIWQSLELPAPSRSGVVDLKTDLRLQLTLNIAQEPAGRERNEKRTSEDAPAEQTVASGDSISEAFPLLRTIEPERDRAIHRFSVTQLINYQRCPRQYYFDRVLHAPAPDALAVWNDAEAPEPPANLTATLKGAVIHRFCETYTNGHNPAELLRRNFAEVVRSRQAQLADRLMEINTEEAIAELLPLAQNYLSSAVFERVERARALSEPPALAGGLAEQVRNGFLLGPSLEAGLWSELGFRMRRPLGILSGAIDKLLITPAAHGNGFDVEIIDFKTNRLRRRTTESSASTSSLGPRAPGGPRRSSPAGVAHSSPSSNEFDQAGAKSDQLAQSGSHRSGRGRARSQQPFDQMPFDFSAPIAQPEDLVSNELSLDDQVRIAASDYQLQMQAYALAVRELMPALVNESSSIISTLHFLEPNIEFHPSADLLSPEACRRGIDEAMMQIVSSREPRQFPVHTAVHCRRCNFLGICPAGREFVRTLRQTNSMEVNLLKAVEAGR
ncbi:MAG TPA: UvrD-helicase domain-containing protein, partial [Pyrinomonadaceae bacterium]|nr:UvrD-helicase domain-containing protein [Pyrinomonadaceae bacterium]